MKPNQIPPNQFKFKEFAHLKIEIVFLKLSIYITLLAVGVEAMSCDRDLYCSWSKQALKLIKIDLKAWEC